MSEKVKNVKNIIEMYGKKSPLANTVDSISKCRLFIYYRQAKNS